MNIQATTTAASSVDIRDLTVAFGALPVIDRLNLEIQSGEFIVLLGPSGCGKSTLLNTIAGLQDAKSGEIHMGGRNVMELEPKDRGIAMVFQSYALYPTMTVERNLSFGLRVARMPKEEIERRVKRAAEILELTPLLKRKPSALSGGQRQRVAIGRALVREVDIFLFDEPLSNLDAQLRAELRVEIKRLHQRLGNTMIYVTHDQVEALTLADRIAVMKGGVIQQLDHPETVYSKPANMFVAKFIGSPPMNFLAGSVSNGVLHAQGADIPLGALAAKGDVTLGIRPENIGVADEAAGKDVTWDALVELREPLGGEALVWCFFGKQRLCIRVKDIDVSLDFYINKLGFQEMLRRHRDNGDLWLVYLRVTDDQYIEVFPYAVGEETQPREAIGLNHICITVDDVENVVRQLEAANVPLIQPLVNGADGNRQAWIADPDGNRYELMQMNSGCLQYEAIKRLKEASAA